MKARTMILGTVAALLLLSAVTLAQSGGRFPSAPYMVERGTASGGLYRLTGLAWQVEGAADGGGYRLSPATPTLRGNGCCCTWIPCVLRNH